MKRVTWGKKKQCNFNCIYCFAKEADYESQEETVLDEVTLSSIEMIQPFCDYDVFACEDCDWKDEISKYVKYGKIVSFATKSFITAEKAAWLTSINQQLLHQGAFLHIGISITTIEEAKKVEPGAPPVELRIEGLKNISKYDIPCSVIIRPLLPSLTYLEMERIVNLTYPFCNNYVFGPLYMNSAIEKYLISRRVEVLTRNHIANWRKGELVCKVYDSQDYRKLEDKLIKYCRQKNKEAFDSNTKAVADIQRRIFK